MKKLVNLLNPVKELQQEKEEAIQQRQQSKEDTAIAMLKDGLPHETTHCVMQGVVEFRVI